MPAARLARVGRALFLPLSLVVLLTAAFVVPLPLIVESPGRLVHLTPCVQVDVPRQDEVDGAYLLTTIKLLPTTTADLMAALARDDVAVVRREEVIPPGTDTGTFFDEQADVFAGTADVAAAVGLRAAGYDVTFGGDGVQVVRTLPGTPADGVLAPGDVITAVDGAAVVTDAELRRAVTTAPRGRSLRVTFTRADVTREVSLTPAELEGRQVLGVEVQTLHPRVELPVQVEVESGRIGGPSAGLMIAVTVYDKVTPDEDLAAGRQVAGTGSIDQFGVVGPIGGIRQKVIAADRHGADVFLTPAPQLEEARAGLRPGSGLELLAVEDFDAAVEALRASRTATSAREALDDEPACTAAN